MDKLQLKSKWLQTNKNERLKSLTKNIKKLRSSRHICSINSLPWKFPQKCLSTETSRITKHRPHHAASFLWFFENCKISTPQDDEKSLMETESLKEKILCDLGFSLPYMNVNLKQLSVEFLSVKVICCQNLQWHSYICDILKIGPFYLIAKSLCNNVSVSSGTNTYCMYTTVLQFIMVIMNLFEDLII